MTLIVGAGTKDFVVIAGDGLATNAQDKTLTKRDFNKVFKLHNEIHFGVAASGISLADIYLLTSEAKMFIELATSYKVKDIVYSFGEFVRNNFKGREKAFSIDFIMGGFDRDEVGRPTRSSLYNLSTKTDYKPKKRKGRQLYYAPMAVPDLIANRKLRNDGDYNARLIFGVLKYMNTQFPHYIGGNCTGVLITREGSKWFEYNLDKQKA